MKTVRNPEGSLQTDFDKGDVAMFNHEHKLGTESLPAVRGRIVFDDLGVVLRSALDGATEAEEAGFWGNNQNLVFLDDVWQYTAVWAATKEGRYQ